VNRWYVAEHTFIVRPGDFVHVPRGVVHYFRVLAPQAKMIATYTPLERKLGYIDEATPLPAEG
jgi:quercetin dioxygenase-like cupin family protein